MSGFWNTHGTAVLWIIAIFVFGRLGLRYLAYRIVDRADDGDPGTETLAERRARSLADLLLSAGKVVIWIVTGLMALSVFGVDTTPILAASGVLAVAVGFGMQKVVGDFMSGVLIYAEGQFAEGDEVTIGDFSGTVERLTVRSTVLRDGEGNAVFLPNGSIASVVNRSRKEQWKRGRQGSEGSKGPKN